MTGLAVTAPLPAGACAAALVLLIARRTGCSGRHARRRLAAAPDPNGASLRPTLPGHLDPPRVLGAAGALAAALALGPAGAVIAAVAVAAAIPVRRWLAVSRQRAARAAQLPDGLERVAAALRSGDSLASAIEDAGRSLPDPLGAELVAVATATRQGQPLVEALDAWAATRPDPDTRAAATVLVVAAGAGASPARAVDGLAATLRERAQMAAERHAAAAQVRWSALILSAAPLGVAVLLGASGSAAGRFLFGTTAGWTCLALGLAADAAGAAWMARLIGAGER